MHLMLGKKSMRPSSETPCLKILLLRTLPPDKSISDSVIRPVAGPSYYERTNYALLSSTMGIFEVQFAIGGSKDWEGRGFSSFAIGYRVGRKGQQSSFSFAE
ncbi:hypothetical protein OWV82_018677 [Melia azedarach]|uniref:Uncharacterized protein n=1 Tax=Melia azedarach TaxID=155640 RepID=A0ACC1XDE0_MELAZ|nr:hypothetical protein OWV82_018677 [Melia azedarach]